MVLNGTPPIPRFFGCDLGRNLPGSDVLVELVFPSPDDISEFIILAHNRAELLNELQIILNTCCFLWLMVDAPFTIPKACTREELEERSLHKRTCDDAYRDLVNQLPGRAFKEHPWSLGAAQWNRWRHIRQLIIEPDEHPELTQVHEGFPQGTICQVIGTCSGFRGNTQIRIQTLQGLEALLWGEQELNLDNIIEANEHILDAAILAVQACLLWNQTVEAYDIGDHPILVPAIDEAGGCIWAINPEVLL